VCAAVRTASRHPGYEPCTIGIKSGKERRQDEKLCGTKITDCSGYTSFKAKW